ncbi:alpha/beta hydrolase [Oceanicella sp. SM1341]|uniref:alpha/beta hydrolase n=1 Tax=Oceanicella sp. SM1341 TaxID=1548889 RepID=UPI000E4C4542|nr:alpha/beta hydrolase [Oceanicella sp. SM1341]
MPATTRNTGFRSGEHSLAAVLHLPEGFEESRRHPCLLLATPGSSVKEQVAAIYGARLAARGFVVLAFDPSCQGASEGLPRGLEDPALRVADLLAAADHLATLPFVDAGRIGLLGICAGGGYAVRAALTDRRFRALATVVGSNIGAAFRTMLSPQARSELLDEVARQRRAEARGAPPRQEPWIPDSLAEAHAQGVSDPDLLQAVAFYREPPWRHENSTNRLHFTSFAHILAFDGFHLVPELLAQPLLVIANGRRGETRAHEQSRALFDMAPGPDKAFHVVEGAGHYEMYHVDAHVSEAVEHLDGFFTSRLAA